jgi:lipopolysaccharide transport system permease protein
MNTNIESRHRDGTVRETRHIRPPGRMPRLDWEDVYRSRELIGVFVRRGIAVRYGQMALGITWSFLEPLGLLLLTSVVFGLFIRVPTGNYPYPVFVFSALIPWLYFNRSTNGAASSLQEHMGIVSKIYFPRVLLPISAVVREFFDSIVLFILLVALAWFYGYPPTWRSLLMPVVFMYLTLPALGVGLSVGSISVKFRDFRPLLQLVLQAGFYVTPIFYPPELVPARLRPLVELNPMYWGVEVSRWITLDKPLAITPSFYLSFVISGLMLFLGYVVFAWYERSVVDAQ